MNTNQTTSKPSLDDCRAIHQNINDMVYAATIGSLSTSYDEDRAAYRKADKIYFNVLTAVNQLVEATARRSV